jgi:hypothetical protein
MTVPQARYTSLGEADIAYQVLGEGRLDRSCEASDAGSWTTQGADEEAVGEAEAAAIRYHLGAECW